MLSHKTNNKYPATYAMLSHKTYNKYPALYPMKNTLKTELLKQRSELKHYEKQNIPTYCLAQRKEKDSNHETSHKSQPKTHGKARNVNKLIHATSYYQASVQTQIRFIPLIHNFLINPHNHCP